MPPKDIEEYVAWVLNQKPGFDQVDKEVQAEMKKLYVDSLQDQINAAILKAMPADKMAEFDRLLSGDNKEAVQLFCDANIPDLKEIIASVLINFKEVYVGV